VPLRIHSQASASFRRRSAGAQSDPRSRRRQLTVASLGRVKRQIIKLEEGDRDRCFQTGPAGGPGLGSSRPVV